MPQFPRLRALVAATLAALVIVTIQPPSPGAAETPSPSAPPAVIAPTAAPTPTPTASLTPAASPLGGGSPAAATTTPGPAPTTTASRKRARIAPKADRVIAIAMAKRGRPWAYGATGPRTFDCSGLVTYAFRRAGVLAQIGSGRYRSGSSMLRWARARHLTRSAGHRGDIVVWGNGAHVGIYLGNGRAISTLTSGVRIHGLRVLNTRFTTFISTGLGAPARPMRATATSASKPTSAATTAEAVTTSATATTLAALRAKVVAHRTVTVTRLNLRGAPRLTAAASRILAGGARLGVLRSTRDDAGRTWYRVIVGARIGWVAGWLTRPAI